MNNSFNNGRQKLLLELIIDNTQDTYQGFSDIAIKKNISKYLQLLNEFESNNGKIDANKLEKLDKLHKYFYGTSFNVDDPNETSVPLSSIYQSFNLTYQQIEELIKETDSTSGDIIKALNGLLTFYYNKNRDKQYILKTYLDNVVIPSVKQFKNTIYTALPETAIANKETVVRSAIPFIEPKPPPKQVPPQQPPAATPEKQTVAQQPAAATTVPRVNLKDIVAAAVLNEHKNELLAENMTSSEAALRFNEKQKILKNKYYKTANEILQEINKISSDIDSKILAKKIEIEKEDNIIGKFSELTQFDEYIKIKVSEKTEEEKPAADKVKPTVKVRADKETPDEENPANKIKPTAVKVREENPAEVKENPAAVKVRADEQNYNKNIIRIIKEIINKEKELFQPILQEIYSKYDDNLSEFKNIIKMIKLNYDKNPELDSIFEQLRKKYDEKTLNDDQLNALILFIKNFIIKLKDNGYDVNEYFKFLYDNFSFSMLIQQGGKLPEAKVKKYNEYLILRFIDIEIKKIIPNVRQENEKIIQHIKTEFKKETVETMINQLQLYFEKIKKLATNKKIFDNGILSSNTNDALLQRKIDELTLETKKEELNKTLGEETVPVETIKTDKLYTNTQLIDYCLNILKNAPKHFKIANIAEENSEATEYINKLKTLNNNILPFSIVDNDTNDNIRTKIYKFFKQLLTDDNLINQCIEEFVKLNNSEVTIFIEPSKQVKYYTIIIFNIFRILYAYEKNKYIEKINIYELNIIEYFYHIYMIIYELKNFSIIKQDNEQKILLFLITYIDALIIFNKRYNNDYISIIKYLFKILTFSREINKYYINDIIIYEKLRDEIIDEYLKVDDVKKVNELKEKLMNDMKTRKYEYIPLNELLLLKTIIYNIHIYIDTDDLKIYEYIKKNIEVLKRIDIYKSLPNLITDEKKDINIKILSEIKKILLEQLIKYFIEGYDISLTEQSKDYTSITDSIHKIIRINQKKDHNEIFQIFLNFRDFTDDCFYNDIEQNRRYPKISLLFIDGEIIDIFLRKILAIFIKKYIDNENSNLEYIYKELSDINDFQSNVFKFIIEKNKETLLKKINETEFKYQYNFLNLIIGEPEIKGGTIKYKNEIELGDVFKLYYNCISSNYNIITNVYKLYFILNIYHYYKKDTIIKELKTIIDTNNYTPEIIVKIKDIYYQTDIIFKEYVMNFINIDSVIKNYYLNLEDIKDYLHLSFIYYFYKTINIDDLNIKLKLGNKIIIFKKSIKEIKSELENFIKTKEYFIFNIDNDVIITVNKSYNADINYLIKFINNYTQDRRLIYDNINDTNALIILQFLSNTNKMINLNINNSVLSIKNIKIHPYIFNINDDFANIKIKLNSIQSQLYTPNNIKNLLAILAHEYYYINFDLSITPRKFKYYINNDIITIIQPNVKLQYQLINYDFYNFVEPRQLKKLTIFNVNGNKLIFIINYAIFISSALYTNVSLYNYFTLIYLYFAIKNSAKNYNEIKNYNGKDKFLNNYKKFISNMNILNYLKNVLIAMQSKLIFNYDFNTFIFNLINFKENIFLNNFNIKINIEFITNLFKIRKQTNNDHTYYLHLAEVYKLLYLNCILPNINNNKYKNDIIKILYIFLLPILKELSYTNIDMAYYENKLLDIKALELLSKIDNSRTLIKGGLNIQSPSSDNNIPRGDTTTQPTTATATEIRVSNSITPDVSKLLADLKIVDSIDKKIEKLNYDDLLKIYLSNISKYTKIKLTKKKDDGEDETKELNIFNTIEIINNIPTDFKKEEEAAAFVNIVNVVNTQIETNSVNVADESKIYRENKSIEQKLIKDITTDLEKLKVIVASLEELKETTNLDIRKILIDFDIISVKPNEEERGVDEPIQLISNIEDLIKKYNELFDSYKSVLQDIENKYKKLSESVKKIQSSYDKDKYNNRQQFRRQYEPDFYRDGGNLIIKGGEDEQEQIKNKLEKFKEDNIYLTKLLDKFEAKPKIENIKKKYRDKIDVIKKDYKKLKTSNIITDSVDKQDALKDFVDTTGNNLFENILYNYDKDYNETTEEIAKTNLYKDVIARNLDPEIELAVNINDKFIFLVIIIILRLSSLYITYYYIDNGRITNIKKAIYYYTLSYTILFFILLIIINIDVFRFRMMFNYLNMHINSATIFAHIVIKIVISYLVYLMILNISSDPSPTSLSKNQKIKLKYKLNILTITILIFLFIFTLVT